MSLTTFVTYETFLDEVLPYVRDVSEAAAINAIKNACIEFCNQSWWLRDEPDGITIVSGTASYELDYPLGYTVAGIVRAGIGQHALKPGSPELLTSLFGDDWRTKAGAVLYYTQEENGYIRLVQVPNTTYTDTLDVILAVKPSRSSTKVDRELWERWAEAIGFGARARLYDTPAQPYHDAKQAVKFRAWFETKIGEARIEAQRGRVRGPLMVRPPKFY
jgi:hypothetical protein